MSEIILVQDIDDGIIVAKYIHSINTPSNGLVKLYKHQEYYHSLDDALKDMYGIKWEDKE